MKRNPLSHLTLCIMPGSHKTLSCLGGWPSFLPWEHNSTGCPSLRGFRRLGTTAAGMRRRFSSASRPAQMLVFGLVLY
jgi:hypothetical protein